MIASNIVLVLFCVLGISTAQMCMKKAAGKRRDERGFIQVFFDRYALLGLVIYAVGFFLWMVVLSRLPLSMAYPLMSLSYVFVIFMGGRLFREQIPVSRYVGSFFIVAGCILISQP